jgi:hydrogenase maturation factor
MGTIPLPHRAVGTTKRQKTHQKLGHAGIPKFQNNVHLVGTDSYVINKSFFPTKTCLSIREMESSF